ncbi:ketopantoate reductase family protein [Blastopirellula marina]|uniref:2-dehydropantoate 2-reductase n=1 Tax=Blastopirellula marina DSM 3645 TaxID=314230 RepID=A3ZX86_9BACT|nr:2-dehydropantoate 2-reductase [Blastopirellula marina]EAQ78971.1 putative 2-dehydropantoate 2-reductase [Blastopirellula marina DSM 3645]
MRTLIVGVGAIGGLIAARLRAAGLPVWLATRDDQSATLLRRNGLRLTTANEDVAVDTPNVAELKSYLGQASFDLIVLATKAHDALNIAPTLLALLAREGVLLPLQNGSIPWLLGQKLGNEKILGGISNFGATMIKPGEYEQRNQGNLLIGELTGGDSERTQCIRRWLGQAIDVRVSQNFIGAVWAKLLLNCSVTTLGAIAGQTMRQYVATDDGRELFQRTYDEALSVALASGVRPERMIVEPIPPGWNERGVMNCDVKNCEYDAWLQQLLDGYGDLKPSMLQDFEHRRQTEIMFINGHVVHLGKMFPIPTPVNAAIVSTVIAIEQGHVVSDLLLLGEILHASS